MATSRGEALGAEGRYRRTPGSPSTANKAPSAAMTMGTANMDAEGRRKSALIEGSREAELAMLARLQRAELQVRQHHQQQQQQQQQLPQARPSGEIENRRWFLNDVFASFCAKCRAFLPEISHFLLLDEKKFIRARAHANADVSVFLDDAVFLSFLRNHSLLRCGKRPV